MFHSRVADSVACLPPHLVFVLYTALFYLILDLHKLFTIVSCISLCAWGTVLCHVKVDYEAKSLFFDVTNDDINHLATIFVSMWTYFWWSIDPDEVLILMRYWWCAIVLLSDEDEIDRIRGNILDDAIVNDQGDTGIYAVGPPIWPTQGWWSAIYIYLGW